MRCRLFTASRADDGGCQRRRAGRRISPNLPPEIVTAFNMYADSEIAEAEQTGDANTCSPMATTSRACASSPRSACDLDVTDDAEVLLGRVLELAPNIARPATNTPSYSCSATSTFAPARKWRSCLRTTRSNPDVSHHLRDGLHRFRRLNKPCPAIGELLVETPGDPELHLSIAHALKTLGRTQEAIDSYRAAAAA